MTGWKDGQKHGIGKLTNCDGSTYDGEWCNDVQHGFGTMTLLDDNGVLLPSYVGGWENGQMHGEGIMTADGLSFDCVMIEGSFISSSAIVEEEEEQDHVDLPDLEGNVLREAVERFLAYSTSSATRGDSSSFSSAAAVVEGADNSSLCLVCMERPKTMAFAPCGHMCLCAGNSTTR